MFAKIAIKIAIARYILDIYEIWQNDFFKKLYYFSSFAFWLFED
jgi:hypothetical protein